MLQNDTYRRRETWIILFPDELELQGNIVENCKNSKRKFEVLLLRII